jgi:hypothetical protein
MGTCTVDLTLFNATVPMRACGVGGIWAGTTIGICLSKLHAHRWVAQADRLLTRIPPEHRGVPSVHDHRWGCLASHAREGGGHRPVPGRVRSYGRRASAASL